MSNLKSIRMALQLTQSELGDVFGQTKSNISQMETGNLDLSVANARKLIEFAKTRGMEINFDAIYAAPVGADHTPQPEPQTEAV